SGGRGLPGCAAAPGVHQCRRTPDRSPSGGGTHMNPEPSTPIDVAVIGGGPAGLMAAEVVSRAGLAAHVFDTMPSVGRKFLLAGKGGMNLTHAEPLDAFVGRYGERADGLRPLLQAFGPQAVRDWAAGLGIATFVG